MTHRIDLLDLESAKQKLMMKYTFCMTIKCKDITQGHYLLCMLSVANVEPYNFFLLKPLEEIYYITTEDYNFPKNNILIHAGISSKPVDQATRTET